MLRGFRLLPLLAAVSLLALAAWQASAIEPAKHKRADCQSGGASRLEVEKSFSDILADLKAGRKEEALLALRRRSEKGPFEGAALYLMGEATYAEGAYGQAVTFYRKAVETDPSLADREGPFGASQKINERMIELKRGPWAGQKTPDTVSMNFLLRRLAGGCE